MNIRTLSVLALCLAGIACQSQTIQVVPMDHGLIDAVGYTSPRAIPLSATQPPEITKLPDHLVNVRFGAFHIGGKTFSVCIGDLPGKKWQLFVDTNGDGDLTNDPTPVWNLIHYKDEKGVSHASMEGFVKVGFTLAGSRRPVTLGVYQFDPTDPENAGEKESLTFYTDYALKGIIRTAKKSYPFLIMDWSATGDFTTKRVEFLIDREQMGRGYLYATRYHLDQPFNLGGTTYELSKIAPLGGPMTITVSKTTVAEIPMPRRAKVFAVGTVFPGLTAETMDHSPIDFPLGFKGHLVMIDFWATWCGPCMGDVPATKAAYEKFHDKGFDLIGISTDVKDMEKQVRDAVSQHQMIWPQIYGPNARKAWELYKQVSIPSGFLVDGDTGMLLAFGDDLRSDRIMKTVQRLRAKKGLLKKGS